MSYVLRVGLLGLDSLSGAHPWGRLIIPLSVTINCHQLFIQFYRLVRIFSAMLDVYWCCHYEILAYKITLLRYLEYASLSLTEETLSEDILDSGIYNLSTPASVMVPEICVGNISTRVRHPIVSCSLIWTAMSFCNDLHLLQKEAFWMGAESSAFLCVYW